MDELRRKKRLTELLNQDEDQTPDKARQAVDNDFYKDETVIEGDPLGPTKINTAEPERNPAGVLDPEYRGGRSLMPSQPPIDIEGEIPANKVEPKSSPNLNNVKKYEEEQTPRQKRSIANATGDLMVGASHALIGLLSGNANRAAMEYGKGNEYMAGQRKQDLADRAKLVKTAGPNGEPILTPTIEAADMQAYVEPKKGGSEKGYAPQKIKSKKTGEVQSASWNGKQFVQYDNNGNIKKTFDTDEWVGYIPDKMQSANTMQGGKDLYKVDPYTQKVTKILGVGGRGDTMGGVTKEEFDLTTKGAAKGRDIIAKTEQDIASTSEARKTLQTTNDPMTFSTTMGSLLRTAVGEKRLSDVEGARYMGDDYKGFMLRGEEYLRSKYSGQIPPTVRQNAINLVDYVNSKLKGQREATAKSYGGAPSLNEQGKKTVKKILGTEEDKTKPVDWRGKYGI